MPFRTFVLAFTGDGPNEDDMPTEKDITEALKEYLGIPNEQTEVNVFTVTLEEMGQMEGVCRKCGEECEDGRLFCDSCSEEMVESTAEEEV